MNAKLLTMTLFIAISSVVHANPFWTAKAERSKGPYSEFAKPGSDYCVSVTAVETQNYNEHKADVDAHMNPIISDMKKFLKTITPAERTIIKVERSGSERLVDLDKRFLKIQTNYGKGAKLLKKEMSTIYQNTGYPKYREWKLEHTDIKTKKTWSLTIEPTTPELEAEEMQRLLERNYLASSLKSYLEYKIDPGCFAESDEHINADDRTPGKDTNEPDNKDKGNQQPGGAVKN